jgi:uncharacterized protein YjbI with pentapeptide repeats
LGVVAKARFFLVSLVGTNLSLVGERLVVVSLVGANLVDIGLAGTSLTGANLEGISLAGANFSVCFSVFDDFLDTMFFPIACLLS